MADDKKKGAAPKEEAEAPAVAEGFEINLAAAQDITIEGRTFTVPAGPCTVDRGVFEALKNSGLL